MGQSFSLLCLYNQSKELSWDILLDSPSKAVIFQLINQDKNVEETIILQNKPRSVKKVCVQIHPSDFRLTKGDTFEEIFLSFHTKILKNF